MEPTYKGTIIKSGYLYNVAVTSISINTSTDTLNYNGNASSFDKLQGNRNLSDIQTFSALKLFFVSQDGQDWFTNLIYLPYFYVGLINDNYLTYVKYFLEQTVDGLVEIVYLEDLSRPNHIKNPKLKQSTKRGFLKLSFATIDLLRQGLNYIKSIKSRFKDSKSTDNITCSRFSHVQQHIENLSIDQFKDFNPDCLAYIDDCYEADVRYVTRVLIDRSIRCASWYDVEITSIDNIALSLNQIQSTLLPPLNILAWDIECYKAPLKFPDMEIDPIMLISFVFNGQGYLLVNLEYISHEISDFSYKPNIDLSGAGTFIVYNEPNEHSMISRFFECIKKLGTHILVTYNGDNFDFPYLYRRAQINNIRNPIHIKNNENRFTRSDYLNIDCYKWVERDSYLPNGSRTLKQVCKIKLKYNPAEVDPEEMITLARNDPQTLATYSVSDAVATYYLYIKFIHNFVLALTYIIPLSVEDVLRQGSGTLCENLLMAEAHDKEIIFPNKHQPEYNKYYQDPNTGKYHLIYDDSYVGGRVETLRCGLYRDDLPEQFNLDSHAYQRLIDQLSEILNHWGKNLNPIKSCKCSEDIIKINKSDDVVGKLHPNLHYFTNIRQVYDDIYTKLTELRGVKELYCLPKVIHLDVGAMYPNIILTNRLQPTAIVDEEFCSKCSYYSESNICQKRMRWRRKFEISPIDRSHILPILNDLKNRSFKSSRRIQTLDESDSSNSDEDINIDSNTLRWDQLSAREQNSEIVKIVKSYSQKTSQKSKIIREMDVESIVCQRENPFYVNTVRKFRDRRYIFKRNVKQAERAKNRLLQSDIIDVVKLKEINESILINDSLQLAHKCILNSFYGYVKRNGSRWFSMEMGAIVTYSGSQIIESARKLIDLIGISIELDTDGIWCMLPNKFPFVYNLHYFTCTCFNTNTSINTNKIPDRLVFEYPTNMLNLLIEKNWTNHQYLEYDDDSESYLIQTKNHIEFELDGPWFGMFLPASEKSDQLLKKRYVVYNHDKNIVELKGFELKRRGELQLIQRFQEEIFLKFVLGSTKQEAYNHAAEVGIRWRKTLDDKARCIGDDMELFDLLMSKSVIKKSVLEQPNMKGFGITTARRLSELLNNPMYIQDRNVSTQFLITNKPTNADKTARAIPIQLFLSDENTKNTFISKWLRIPPAQASQLDSRDILDWDYYKQRLDTQLLKLICIPCIIQQVQNPIPSIKIPDWICRKERALNPTQSRITSFFNKSNDLTTRIVEPQIIEIDSEENNQFQSYDTIISKEIDRLRNKWAIHALNLTRRKLGRVDTVSDNLYTFLKGVRMEPLTIDDLYTLFTECWHIIDLQCMDCIFKCHISIYNKNKFYNIYLSMRRRIYINFDGEISDLPPEVIGKSRVLRIKYHLPRSAEPKTLLQFEMDEDSDQSIYTLNALFHNKIKAIYESKIPLVFDFIVGRGNQVTLEKNLQSGVEPIVSDKFTAFNEKALSPASFRNNYSKYLADVDLFYIYIYSIQDPMRFVAIVYSTVESSIFFGSKQGISTNLPDLLKRFKAEYRHPEGYEYIRFPACISDFSNINRFEHKSASLSCKNALKSLNQYLESLVEYKKCCFIINSTEEFNLDSIYNNIITINKMDLEFRLKHAPDSSYIQSYINDSLSLLEIDYYNFEEKLCLSRASGIPINLLITQTSSDSARLFLDVLYARSLRSSNHILWSRDTPLDYDVAPTIRMTNPGIYRGFIVKIEFDPSIIFHAIRHANTSDDSLSILSQTLDGVLKILMNLYQSTSYQTFKNLFQSLTNIRAWLSDPSSILYDYTLYNQIIVCYEAYLSQLLVQLKSRFGIYPIAVDSTSALLDTGLINVEMGRQLIDLALKGIKSLNYYESVSFTVSEEFVAAIQLNEDNFIRFREYSSHNTSNSVERMPLLDFYPIPIQGFFRDLVDRIVLTPLINTINSKKLELDELSIAIRNLWIGEGLYQGVEKLLRDKSTFLSEYSQIEEDEDDSVSASNVPASNVKNVSNVKKHELEFPNTIYQFGDWKAESVGLVTSLMDMERTLNIQKDGELQEVMYKFKSIVGIHLIPNILERSFNRKPFEICCSECSSISSINITNLSLESKCEYCNETWNHNLLESKLIQYIEELCYAIQGQQFNCVYCNHLRTSYLAEKCTCGNIFKDSIDFNIWKFIVNVLKQLSINMEFNLLKSVTKHIELIII